MKVFIVTPGDAESTAGNSITAQRWAILIRQLEYEAVVDKEWKGESCEVLIALHAVKSNPSIERFRTAHPNRPLIVALTGTDLYGALGTDHLAQRSLSLATRIVALQSKAADELGDETRARLHVIYQSAVPLLTKEPPRADCFEVSVLSHLREVKDPLRAAWAARELPAASKIRIVHAGRPLESKWEKLAVEEERINPRYRWLREISHDLAVELLARSRVLVVSSLVEGGANVIVEAAVNDVPVLCTEIPGNVGMMGADYPGYFPICDTLRLSSLLRRVESDPTFTEALRAAINCLKNLFSPQQELESWRLLLQSIRRG